MQKFFFSMMALLTLTMTCFGQTVESPFGRIFEEFVIEAVGTYRGQTVLDDIEIDDSGHRVTQMEVVVDNPEQPVVLVLTAYDPTVWRIGRTKNTEIAGIMLSGYYQQVLIGAEKEIPVQISTYKKKGEFKYFFAHKANKRLLDMNDQLKRIFGREMRRFHTDGQITQGDKKVAPEDVLYFDDYKLEDYNLRKKKQAADSTTEALANRPIAGQAALDALAEEGKLRLATRKEIEAWVDKASKPYKKFNPNLRVDTLMRVGQTYVVLDELVLPNGLAGAHSRSFIIPEKVAFPKGPRGHNSFYRMDGTKAGVAAMMDR